MTEEEVTDPALLQQLNTAFGTPPSSSSAALTSTPVAGNASPFAPRPEDQLQPFQVTAARKEMPPEWWRMGTGEYGGTTQPIYTKGGLMDVLASRIIADPARLAYTSATEVLPRVLPGIGRAIGDMAGGQSYSEAFRKDIEPGMRASLPAINAMEAAQVQPTTAPAKVADWMLGLPGRGLHAAGQVLDVAAGPFTYWASPEVQGTVSGILQTAPTIAATAYGAIKGLRSMRGEAPTMIEPEATQPGPMASLSEAESARLDSIYSAAQKQGLRLPQEGASPRAFAEAQANNRQVVPAIVRKDMGLGEGTPLTPKVYDAYREQVAAQTYAPVAEQPAYAVPPSVRAALDKLPDNIIERYAIPKTNIIGGEDLTRISRGLRAQQSKYWAAYERGGDVAAQEVAANISEAVSKLEDSASQQLTLSGHPEIAENWDMGRTKIAQSYDYERATTNPYEIDMSRFRRAYSKAPQKYSGTSEMLGETVARNPKAFGGVVNAPPQAGLLRTAVGRSMPLIGAGLGSSFGPPGAMFGTVVGERAQEYLTK